MASETLMVKVKIPAGGGCVFDPSARVWEYCRFHESQERQFCILYDVPLLSHGLKCSECLDRNRDTSCMEGKNMEKGNKVTIYDDPITRTITEDEAILLTKIREDGIFHDDEGKAFKLETWAVLFANEAEAYDREIRVDL